MYQEPLMVGHRHFMWILCQKGGKVTRSNSDKGRVVGYFIICQIKETINGVMQVIREESIKMQM